MPNDPLNNLVATVTKRQSTEISALLCDSTLNTPSSVELGWKNFTIERRTSLPSEKPEIDLQNHFLILWDAHVAEGEMAYRSDQFSPYKKYPNSITTCLPGPRPPVRNWSKHEVIVGALQSEFIRGVEGELDKFPSGNFHGLYGTDDPDLRSLILLLVKESESGGGYGTLYAESLTVALATRLLYAARLQKVPANKISPLSPRALRRVLDRMHTDLSVNLDLATLAAESGYSRAHFLRTFRTATGQTPHQYLTELRLTKAQALIATRSMSLVDIAAACGFSSHAHFATAFRSKFGLSPSSYRSSL